MDEQNFNSQENEENKNVEVANETSVETLSQNEQITNEPVVSGEEVIQDFNANVENENAPKRGKKIWGIVVAIVAIILVVVSGVVIYATNRGARVIDMCFDDYMFGYIDEINDISSKNNKLSFKAEFDADEFMEALGAESQDIGKLSLNLSTLKKDDKFASKVTLNSNQNELLTLKVLLDNLELGVAVPELFDDYVVVDLSDTEWLSETLELDKEKITTAIEKIKENKETTTKLEKLYKKYFSILKKNVGNDVKVERNVAIEINDEEINTTKHCLTLDAKKMLEVCIAILENARDDNELFELVVINSEAEISLEDWQDAFDEEILKMENAITKAEKLDENLYLAIEAYRKGTDTVAIKFALSDDTEEYMSIRVAALNKKSNSYVDMLIESDGAQISIFADTKKTDNKLDCDLGIFGVMNGRKESIKLISLVLEGSNVSASEFDEFGENALIVNTATEDELEAWENKFGTNLVYYLLNLSSKLPKGLSSLISSLGDLNHGSELYDDDEYNYDYDDYDYDNYEWDYDDYDYDDYDWYSDYDYDYSDYDL